MIIFPFFSNYCCFFFHLRHLWLAKKSLWRLRMRRICQNLRLACLLWWWWRIKCKTKNLLQMHWLVKETKRRQRQRQSPKSKPSISKKPSSKSIGQKSTKKVDKSSSCKKGSKHEPWKGIPANLLQKYRTGCSKCRFSCMVHSLLLVQQGIRSEMIEISFSLIHFN